MRLEDIRVGLRVEVPQSKVTDQRPWQEPYGTVVEVDSFVGIPEILVRLDGESAAVIKVAPEELEPE